jgi:thiol-disulfide isomerase/thioredoxin
LGVSKKVRQTSVLSVFLNNNSVKQAGFRCRFCAAQHKGAGGLKALSFPAQVQATAWCCGKVHDKIIQRRDRRDGVCIDRMRCPAHYGCVVKVRLAPEARGKFGVKALAALCGAGAVFYFAMLPLRAEAAELQRWTAGRQSTFSLPTIAGTTAELESERGHIVLVHFFATWCEPCREELPALNRLAARSNGDVKVLAIAVADADQRVQRFFETTPVDFPVLLDRDRAVAKAWNVTTLPATFVLDASLQPKLVVETDCAWDSLDPKELTSTSVRDARGSTSIKDASNR